MRLGFIHISQLTDDDLLRSGDSDLFVSYLSRKYLETWVEKAMRVRVMSRDIKSKRKSSKCLSFVALHPFAFPTSPSFATDLLFVNTRSVAASSQNSWIANQLLIHLFVTYLWRTYGIP